MSGHYNEPDSDIRRALELILPQQPDFFDELGEPATAEHAMPAGGELPATELDTSLNDGHEAVPVIPLELPEITSRRFNRARAAVLGTAAVASAGTILAALSLFDTPRGTHPAPAPQLTTPQKTPGLPATPQTKRHEPVNKRPKAGSSSRVETTQKPFGKPVSTRPESTVQYNTAPVPAVRQQAAPPVTEAGRTADTASVQPLANRSSSDIAAAATETGGAAPSGIEAPAEGSGGVTYGNGTAQPSGGVTPTVR